MMAAVWLARMSLWMRLAVVLLVVVVAAATVGPVEPSRGSPPGEQDSDSDGGGGQRDGPPGRDGSDSGSDDEAAAGPDGCVDLVAGRETVAGQVCLKNDADRLEVTYATSGEWQLAETHLAVSTDPAGSGKWEEQGWQNPSGNPAPGRFPHKTAHGPATSEFTYTIALDELDAAPLDELTVAAHAEVTDGDGRQGAWGQGQRFVDRGNWGMHFSYRVRPWIRWQPQQISQALAQSRATEITVAFQSNASLTQASLQATGDLADMVTFDQSTVTDIAADQPETVTATVTVPADADPGTLQTGAIEVGVDGLPLRQTLPVDIEVLNLAAQIAAGEVGLAPEAVVLDNAGTDRLTSVDAQAGTLEFEGATSQLEALEPGDILVVGPTGPTPEGYAGVVTDVIIPNTSVETMPMPLGDAANTYDLDANVDNALDKLEEKSKASIKKLKDRAHKVVKAADVLATNAGEFERQRVEAKVTILTALAGELIPIDNVAAETVTFVAGEALPVVAGELANTKGPEYPNEMKEDNYDDYEAYLDAARHGLVFARNALDERVGRALYGDLGDPNLDEPSPENASATFRNVYQDHGVNFFPAALHGGPLDTIADADPQTKGMEGHPDSITNASNEFWHLLFTQGEPSGFLAAVWEGKPWKLLDPFDVCLSSDWDCIEDHTIRLGGRPLDGFPIPGHYDGVGLAEIIDDVRTNGIPKQIEHARHELSKLPPSQHHQWLSDLNGRADAANELVKPFTRHADTAAKLADRLVHGTLPDNLGRFTAPAGVGVLVMAAVCQFCTLATIAGTAVSSVEFLDALEDLSTLDEEEAVALQGLATLLGTPGTLAQVQLNAGVAPLVERHTTPKRNFDAKIHYTGEHQIEVNEYRDSRGGGTSMAFVRSCSGARVQNANKNPATFKVHAYYPGTDPLGLGQNGLLDLGPTSLPTVNTAGVKVEGADQADQSDQGDQPGQRVAWQHNRQVRVRSRQPLYSHSISVSLLGVDPDYGVHFVDSAEAAWDPKAMRQRDIPDDLAAPEDPEGLAHPRGCPAVWEMTDELPDLVPFADPELYEAVLHQYGLPGDEPITVDDVADKTVLGARYRDITSLQGLQEFESLIDLRVQHNALDDRVWNVLVSPLKMGKPILVLTSRRLKNLVLAGNPGVSDVGPLAIAVKNHDKLELSQMESVSLVGTSVRPTDAAVDDLREHVDTVLIHDPAQGLSLTDDAGTAPDTWNAATAERIKVQAVSDDGDATRQAGIKVSLSLVDSQGDNQSQWLDGTLETTTDTYGVAEFGEITLGGDIEPGDYELHATADGLQSAKVDVRITDKLVLTTSGAAELVTDPPASLRHHEGESDAIQVIPEPGGVLQDPLPLNITEPRKYTDFDELTPGEVPATEGADVDSVLVHYDPPGTPNWPKKNGSAEFTRDIAGVIINKNDLYTSAGVLGFDDVTYPYENIDGGPNAIEGVDWLELGEDRRTVNFYFSAKPGIDQARVVFAPVESS